MNKYETMDYIRKNFNCSGSTQRLLENILDYVASLGYAEVEQHNALCLLLDGTIGLTDSEIKSINL